MIIRVSNAQGLVAYVDNDGQVNGAVRIQGDTPLASHLHRILNLKIEVPFGGQRNLIDGDFLIERLDAKPALYKASDKYIKEYFIPVECTALGYSVEVLKET